MANVHRGRHKRAYKITDFMPSYIEKPKQVPKTQGDLWAKINETMMMAGGR